MDQLDDYSYYAARAESSRELAQRAASPAIAAIHAQLASRYDDLVAQTGLSEEWSYRDAQAA